MLVYNEAENVSSLISAVMNQSDLFVEEALGEDYLSLHPQIRAVFIAALIIVSVTGTFGNILIIVAVSSTKALKNAGNVFIVNLAIADLFVTTIVDPWNVVGALLGRRYFDEKKSLCDFIASMCFPACMCSMFSICAISINRYILICRYSTYQKVFTWRNSVLICIALWIFAHLIHLPNYLGWGENAFAPDYYICTSSIATQSYSIFNAVLGMFSPAAIIIVMYIKIFLYRRNVKRNVRTSSQKQTGKEKRALVEVGSKTVDASDGCPPRRTFRMIRTKCSREDLKLAKTLFTIAVAFLVCWVPFGFCISMGQPDYIPPLAYLIVIFLAHANSSVNSILYGLTNDRFRHAYMHVLGIRTGLFSMPMVSSKQSAQPETPVSLPTGTSNPLGCVKSDERANGTRSFRQKTISFTGSLSDAVAVSSNRQT